jgi:hypothetical protein
LGDIDQAARPVLGTASSSLNDIEAIEPDENALMNFGRDLSRVPG